MRWARRALKWVTMAGLVATVVAATAGPVSAFGRRGGRQVVVTGPAYVVPSTPVAVAAAPVAPAPVVYAPAMPAYPAPSFAAAPVGYVPAAYAAPVVVQPWPRKVVYPRTVVRFR